MKRTTALPYFLLAIFTASIVACGENPPSTVGTNTSDSLTEEQQHLPENALRGLSIADGLEVTQMASEPMLKNPTNIDVDDRGRIWVTEAYNYRPGINGNPVNAKGDRIMILEDTNGDGKLDSAKVFYQGPEINAPLGVCVLGNRVIISQSPYVWNFYDDNGDDKADRKEIMFQGIGGEQHDHGVHSFIAGPDGKLYFTFGNAGETLKDKNGQTILDQDGDPIDRKKYKEGMVFRCEPDGSKVECLGNNFRNNYEVAVDSYGTMWQSDNDDDGNRATRINYVMDYGNYGFTDELTGAGWEANRTNIEDSIPLRHWHLNDPGVVPNLLQTGAGSPTGMVIYEGNLFPEKFHNQIIHCDAGPNVVRSYPVKKSGAGYTAEIVNVLKGEKDQWFRPADICIAPDGSLIIADWYDPGVGGHAAGDQQRGRIYRVAPKSSAYKIPTFDYASPKGAIQALQNPNLAVRYKAWQALKNDPKKSIPVLEESWRNNKNPRMQARAFWVLVKLSDRPDIYINEALRSSNPDLRIAALHAARQLNQQIAAVTVLLNDPDKQVLRESALTLHHVKDPAAATLWAKLASKHDGRDRWYLEALGIGADRQWDTFFTAYMALVPDAVNSPGGRDIIWRARTAQAVPYIAALAAEEKNSLNQRLRYFRAFDFNSGEKSKYLLAMLEKNAGHDTTFSKLVLRHMEPAAVKASPIAMKALEQSLAYTRGVPEYFELINRYSVQSQGNLLLKYAIDSSANRYGRQAARTLLNTGGNSRIWNVIRSNNSKNREKVLVALGGVGSKESIDILQQVMLSNRYDQSTRKIAAGNVGRSWSGEDRVLELLKTKTVPQSLIPDLVSSVSHAWRGAIRSEAASYLPPDKRPMQSKMPEQSAIFAMKANLENGKEVFQKLCAICHEVNNQGFDFGPKLSEIGDKLPKEGLFDAIVHPSAGIGFGYEGWELKLKDGSTVSGIISSKTETDIDIKFPGGSSQRIKTNDVTSMKEMKESMMPEGLHSNISEQELADLIGYLTNLKKAK